MADKDFLDYDLLIASGMSPPVANALLTMWERTGAARDVSQALDEIQAGVAQWGSIEGDISAQTDLQAALDAIEPADGETFLDLGGQEGSRNLDYEAADVQAITVTGNLTLGVDNWPVPGELGELRVILYDADQHTVSLPGTWAEGVTPTFSSHDRIALYSEDGGNTVYKVRYFQASERTIKWGNLTGTLSDQTDLQSALDAKTDTGHTHTISDVTALQAALDQAGPVLVGGVSDSSNLDTVNGGDSTTSNTDTYIAGAA